MIHNPIFKGFNPDPCICRKNDDYYAAVSSFEWFPGIPVYHSKDLKNWELYTHVLTDDEKVKLRKLPSAKGIWAPCLTYCEPVYLNSAGFDASMFHDDDGKNMWYPWNGKRGKGMKSRVKSAWWNMTRRKKKFLAIRRESGAEAQTEAA